MPYGLRSEWAQLITKLVVMLDDNNNVFVTVVKDTEQTLGFL